MGFGGRFLFVYLLALALIAPSGAWAKDKHSKLTQFNIKDFIEETSAITTGSKSVNIAGYLQQHVSSNARFKSEVTFQIPGYDEQTQQLSLNKQEFIAHSLQAAETLQDYNVDVSIRKTSIDKDGERATVYTITEEYGTMPMPQQDGRIAFVPVEGETSCMQILTLTRKGLIQMHRATCETTIAFQQH